MLIVRVLALACCALAIAVAEGATIDRFIVTADDPAVPVGGSARFTVRAVDVVGDAVPLPDSRLLQWTIIGEDIGALTAAAQGVEFRATAPGCATISVRLVRGAASGMASVRAYAQRFGSFSVQLAEAPGSLQRTLAIDVGHDHPFTAFIYDQFGRRMVGPAPRVAWTVPPAARATLRVLADGTASVRTLTTGPLTITATAADGQRSSYAVIVYAPVLDRIYLDRSPYLASWTGRDVVAPGEAIAYRAIGIDQAQLPLRAQPAVAWKVRAGGVGAITQAGVFRAMGEGFAEVSASVGGIASYPVPIAVAAPTGLWAGTDAITRGDWGRAYGRDGAEIASGYQYQADYDLASYKDLGRLVERGGSTHDPRALIDLFSHDYSTPTPRTIADFTSPTAFGFPLDIADDHVHVLSLYLLDWYRQGAIQRVEIIDARSGAVLDWKNFANFGEGVYARWLVKGRVRVKVTPLTAAPAMVAGIFLNPYAVGG